MSAHGHMLSESSVPELRNFVKLPGCLSICWWWETFGKLCKSSPVDLEFSCVNSFHIHLPKAAFKPRRALHQKHAKRLFWELRHLAVVSAVGELQASPRTHCKNWGRVNIWCEGFSDPSIPKVINKTKPDGDSKVNTTKKGVHVALPHHSYAPAGAAGWAQVEGTALGAHWSLPRSEGLGLSLAPRPLPCCQDSAPPLSVGVTLPGWQRDLWTKTRTSTV